MVTLSRLVPVGKQLTTTSDTVIPMKTMFLIFVNLAEQGNKDWRRRGWITSTFQLQK